MNFQPAPFGMNVNVAVVGDRLVHSATAAYVMGANIAIQDNASPPNIAMDGWNLWELQVYDPLVTPTQVLKVDIHPLWNAGYAWAYIDQVRYMSAASRLLFLSPWEGSGVTVRITDPLAAVAGLSLVTLAKLDAVSGTWFQGREY